MTPAALQLDFVRPVASAWRWVGWCALALAAIGVVAGSEVCSRVAQAHEAAQGRHDLVEARLRGSGPRRAVVAPDAQTLADVHRANAVIDQLTVPWEDLFGAVEAADARGLGLLSLTPNARERSLRLVGESRSIDELLDYVERLAAQPTLSQVHLLGYSTPARDGVSVVSFNLAATWRSPP